MTYAQITLPERYAIWSLRKLGYTPAAIARELKRHRSTITREVRRNIWRENGVTYQPLKAQSYTNERRRVSRRGSQFSDDEWAFVEDLLREDWSPEQIVGWCARFGLLTISHETIYRRIWKDRARGGTLWRHLRVVTKKYRKRYGAYDSRGRLAGCCGRPPASRQRGLRIQRAEARRSATRRTAKRMAAGSVAKLAYSKMRWSPLGVDESAIVLSPEGGHASVCLSCRHPQKCAGTAGATICHMYRCGRGVPPRAAPASRSGHAKIRALAHSAERSYRLCVRNANELSITTDRSSQLDSHSQPVNVLGEPVKGLEVER